MAPPVDPEIQFINDTVKQLCEQLKLKYTPEIKEGEVHLDGIWVRRGSLDVPEECITFDMMDDTITAPGFVIEGGILVHGGWWDAPEYDVFHISTIWDKWDAAKWLIMHTIGMEIDNILNSGEPLDYDEQERHTF